MAMKMNDGNKIQQRESSAKDIANAVLTALGITTKTTNTLTTTHIPLRASSTMESTDASIISPPLSPIIQQSSILHNTDDTNINYHPVAPTPRSRNQPRSFPLPSELNNYGGLTTDALLTSSSSVLIWSLTSKGKYLLIVSNQTFKCNKQTNTKRCWRCDEGEYCNIWVQTTLDGNYINMNKSDRDHYWDPDHSGGSRKLVRRWRSRSKNGVRRLFRKIQPPFITFLVGKNEKQTRQGVAVAGSPSFGTATA
jgi:hypothetical protein